MQPIDNTINNTSTINEDIAFELASKLNAVEILDYRKPIWKQFFCYYRQRLPNLPILRRVCILVYLLKIGDDGYYGEEDIKNFISMMLKELQIEGISKDLLYRDVSKGRSILSTWIKKQPKYTILYKGKSYEFEIFYDLRTSRFVRWHLRVSPSSILDFYQGETECYIAKAGEIYKAKKTERKKVRIKKVGDKDYVALK